MGDNLVNSYINPHPNADKLEIRIRRKDTLTLPQSRKLFCIAIAAAILLLACMAITDLASAQTYNPQQQPNFGDFNGTRPDLGGNFSFPDGFNDSQGFPNGGDFNGTFPNGGDGNYTNPNFSGAPNQYDSNNAASPEAVSGSQTDYTLIIAAAIVVVIAVAIATLMLTRKKKTAKSMPPPPPPKEQENFDF